MSRKYEVGWTNAAVPFEMSGKYEELEGQKARLSFKHSDDGVGLEIANFFFVLNVKM